MQENAKTLPVATSVFYKKDFICANSECVGGIVVIPINDVDTSSPNPTAEKT